MNFKTRIKELRNEKKLSQLKFAKMLDLKQTTISQWEMNGIIPRFEILLKLLKMFDCSLDYLMGLTEIRNAEKDLNNLLSEREII